MTRAVVLKILLGSLGVAVLLPLVAWALGAFVGLSGHGVATLILGTVLSMALGIGLMVAVFASSRSGHDDAIADVTRPRDTPDDT